MSGKKIETLYVPFFLMHPQNQKNILLKNSFWEARMGCGNKKTSDYREKSDMIEQSRFVTICNTQSTYFSR